MILKNILKNTQVIKVVGNIDLVINSLSQDSRDNDYVDGLYFAVIGTQTDGHKYIDEVISKGAKCIVCSRLPDTLNEHITYVLVNDVSKEIGKMTSLFYKEPSKKIKIIAVTGTNGKTSIATFLHQSLGFLGEKVLLLSTAGDYYGPKKIDITRKAPSSLETIELHKILNRYCELGADYCCLEATSIGLDQGRLAGVDIDVAIFTNLADDHLDYHGKMNKYAEAKKILFDGLGKNSYAITNGDDSYGAMMLGDTSATKKIVSMDFGDYIFSLEDMNIAGMNVNINDMKISVPLIGKFNAYNVAQVYACLDVLGYKTEKIISSLKSINGVPGRMQSIQNNRDILVLVDYAHSADALENVLQTLISIPHNNIITVVGCGGDRDITKRSPMAQVSQQLSDYSIYTADNPRTENVADIFKDMKKGVDTDKDNFTFEPDREKAIALAVEKAQYNDIVLIAGKGHENYQIIGTEKKYFDDTIIATKYLKE